MNIDIVVDWIEMIYYNCATTTTFPVFITAYSNLVGYFFEY